MTPDELEAVIRRALTRAVAIHLGTGRIDTAALNQATGAILDAARKYAQQQQQEVAT